MQEIRFRYSEDRLKDVLQRRRNAIVGYFPVACSFCGSHRYVLTSVADGTAECEECFAKRWIKENIGDKND